MKRIEKQQMWKKGANQSLNKCRSLLFIPMSFWIKYFLFQNTEYELQLQFQNVQELENNKRVLQEQNQELIKNYEEKELQVKEYSQKW